MNPICALWKNDKNNTQFSQVSTFQLFLATTCRNLGGGGHSKNVSRRLSAAFLKTACVILPTLICYNKKNKIKYLNLFCYQICYTL